MAASGSTKPLIFISAAEPSADLHGANLIRAYLTRDPETRFVGVAGPRMVEAGCQSIFNMTGHAAMLANALGVAGRGIGMLRTAHHHLRQYPFAAAVVIDSPTLHLPLAARAHALGIPVIYYIAPQLWAWGTWRMRKLRHDVDRVAAILPFEEAFLRAHGVDARFVGHPLLDELNRHELDHALIDAIRRQGSPVVSLLPGSRSHVVREVLPGQLEVARRIINAYPKAVVTVSVAGDRVAPIVKELTARANVPIVIKQHAYAELIEAADLVLVASGTTTLEVALRGKPMVVMYNASPWVYNLAARWLLHTPWLSLPNILAGRELVPEFMPYYRSAAPIADCALELLGNDGLRSRLAMELAALTAPLRDRSASKNTAGLLAEMVQLHAH